MNSQPRKTSLTVLVGIGAGIAAYKVATLVRELRKHQYRVIAVPTDNSLNFVGRETWRELSESPVVADIFRDQSGQEQMGHIELARQADLIVVAPCTADLGAKFRLGSASDLLSAVILASEAPKILVPAMHTNMWLDPATQENFAVLESRGFSVIPPQSGQLSSGDSGLGRMPEPKTIFAEIEKLLVRIPNEEKPKDLFLSGKNVLVTAGGTVEPIDPVRYLANNSSGRQGIEIAKAAADAGAKVTLLAANCTVELPANGPELTVVRSLTAQELQREVTAHLPQTDILIMAAAVADYRPENFSDSKLKKDAWGSEPVIRLVQNPDILKEVTQSSERPEIVVGFGAETGTVETVLKNGQKKALEKGADFLAVNRVGIGQGFGEVNNELWVLDSTGKLVEQFSADKAVLAQQLLRLVVGFAG